jgi:hypothetical protein
MYRAMGAHENRALRRLERRDAAELLRSVALGDVDLEAGILSSDEGLLRLVVVRMGVQVHRHGEEGWARDSVNE